MKQTFKFRLYLFCTVDFYVENLCIKNQNLHKKKLKQKFKILFPTDFR